MALPPGTRLGPYNITAKIGEGGMGEVYCARDTKLNRDVAIKILPKALATDPERIARFEREAKTLAALNHPNIAHIHGLEESGSIRALVMELVEGPTLADRIARGPIPTEEALSIATQIAEAMDAAHERGIVHRDLKPANIKLTQDGVVKLLDFGLAKGIRGESLDLTHSPTVLPDTIDGVLLGTVPYMSPEQARGRPVDKRTDIWAFGCVLYEMLTGRAALAATPYQTRLRLSSNVSRTGPGCLPRRRRFYIICSGTVSRKIGNGGCVISATRASNWKPRPIVRRICMINLRARRADYGSRLPPCS